MLEDVFITAGEHDKLTFQYVLYSYHSNFAQTRVVRKKTSVPVPAASKDDAMRALQHYKSQLEMAGR